MAGRGWWKDTGMIVGAVTAFMMVSAYAAWPWWEFAFLSDGSPVSWLSGAMLVANAAIALNLTVTGSLPSKLGYALTAALAALALDEQFQLHERLQESAEFGSLGHLPTWLVGIGGLAFLVALLRTIKPRAGQGLIAAAVALGIFALWVDLGRPPAAVARLEEAYEVLAESLFLCGLFEVSKAQVQSAS